MEEAVVGILNKDEIQRRLQAGELVRSARRGTDGRFDVEPASYDLMAGKVVWKQPTPTQNKEEVVTQSYDPGLPPDAQPTVSVQPGQMLFVITHEQLKMPKDLCGTVLSKNRLAKLGILALNAGHVDPGYEGPILIRLISLRAKTWTLKLGDPIFTIIFHTLDSQPGDELVRHAPLSAERALEMVREMADNSLSNALFELHALEIKHLLYEHYATVLGDLRKELSTDFLKKDEFGRTFWRWFWLKALGTLSFFALIMTIIVRSSTIRELIGKWLK